MRRPGHKHTGKNCGICAIDQTGLRITKQRLLLLETVRKESQPLSAEQIHDQLRSNAVEINLSTVYRILDQFVEKGLILKTILQDEGKAVYGINTHEHSHHLICTKCKQIITIVGCPLDDYGTRLETLYGYTVTGHKLEIYGLCPNCKMEAL